MSENDDTPGRQEMPESTRRALQNATDPIYKKVLDAQRAFRDTEPIKPRAFGQLRVPQLPTVPDIEIVENPAHRTNEIMERVEELVADVAEVQRQRAEAEHAPCRGGGCDAGTGRTARRQR